MSENNGETYFSVSKGLPYINVLRICASKDGYIYAVGIRQEVVYRLNTNDAQSTWHWEVITGGFDKSVSVSDLMTTPTGDLIVASGTYGILRTTNHGNTWETLTNSINTFYGKNPVLQSVAMGKPGELVTVVTATGIPGRFIWRSEDNGANWTKLPTPPLVPGTDQVDVNELAIANNGNIIVSTTYYENATHDVGIGGRLITSSDTGKTWVIRYERPFPYDELEKKCPIDRMIKVKKSGMIYANGHGYVVRSMDGIVWDTIDTDKKGDEKFMMTISPNEDHIFQMSEPDGIVRSDDGGKTWEGKNKGLLGYMLYNIGINSNRVLFTQSEFGLHHSTDHGVTWTEPLEYERESYINTLMVAKNDYVYLGCDFALFRSTDAGETIGIVLGENSDSVTSRITALAESGKHTIYAAMHETKAVAGTGSVSTDKLMRSSTNGNTWDTVPNMDDILRVAASNDTIFVAGNLTQSFRISTNDGQTWNQMPSTTSSGPAKLLMHTDGSFLTYFPGASGGCWRLVPGNSAWTKIFPPEGFTDTIMDYFGMDNDDMGTIFISTDSGIYRSTNSSFSQWQLVSSGLVLSGYDSSKYLNVAQIVKDPVSKNYYAAVRGLSVFESVPNLSPTGGVRNPGGFASGNSSMVNYPNPFATATTINFELKNASMARLEVYDAMGRSIKTMPLGYLSTGDQSVSFEGGELPSGNYLVVLRAGAQVESTWMTITK